MQRAGPTSTEATAVKLRVDIGCDCVGCSAMCGCCVYSMYSCESPPPNAIRYDRDFAGTMCTRHTLNHAQSAPITPHFLPVESRVLYNTREKRGRCDVTRREFTHLHVRGCMTSHTRESRGIFVTSRGVQFSDERLLPIVGSKIHFHGFSFHSSERTFTSPGPWPLNGKFSL